MARIPVKFAPTEKPLRKPDWIRIRLSHSPQVKQLKEVLRDQRLHTVCEEASCACSVSEGFESKKLSQPK